MSHAELVTAQAPDVQIVACTRGAHLMTWTTHGVERLWMSSLSGYAGQEAIRGGVPVLFPQFGTFGELPKHGFARTALWTQVPAVGPPDDLAPDDLAPARALLSFELTDTDLTRAIWPHPFHARLDIGASAQDLTMALAITNRGTDTMRFTGGLHTYLAVADPAATISGLDGCRCWDGVSTRAPRFAEPVPGPIRALDAQDRVMSATAPIASVVLEDGVLGTVAVTAAGFANRVVWNPGPGNELADVADGDEAHFVCIEPAVVEPVALAPGQTWAASQALSLA